MSAKYLLPCSFCGETIPIEVSRAGQQIECVCGASLEIPTMAGVRTLQRAEPHPDQLRPPSRWEVRNGVLLVGVIITLASLCITMYLYVYRPRLRDLEEMSPFETFMAWQFLSEGVRRPVFEINPHRIHQMRVEVNRRWMVVGLLAVAIGLVAMGASALIPKRRMKRRVVRIRVQESGVPPADPPAEGNLDQHT